MKLKLILFLSMLLIMPIFSQGALFKSVCWSLSNGVACINGSTGTNILTGMTINETDPFFTANKTSIWAAINARLLITDQRYNETGLYNSLAARELANNITQSNQINLLNTKIIWANNSKWIYPINIKLNVTANLFNMSKLCLNGNCYTSLASTAVSSYILNNTAWTYINQSYPQNFTTKNINVSTLYFNKKIVSNLNSSYGIWTNTTDMIIGNIVGLP